MIFSIVTLTGVISDAQHGRLPFLPTQQTSMANTIHSFRVRPLIVPMPEPHRTASGAVTASPLVLVDVTTTDGAVGHGLVFTYTAAALKPTAELITNLAPLTVGDPVSAEAVTDKLLARMRLLGPHGLVGIAIAAFDMALADAEARIAGKPLHALLGAAHRTTPCYGGIGFDGAEGSAKVAERWAGIGMRGVKAKIGYASVEEDIAVIRAIRSAAGPDMAIMVDYNQSLTIEQAIQRIARLEEENLAWVEEPTTAEDYAGHARIAAAARTPIQAGENWWGPREFEKAIAAKATDLLMPDVMKGYGVTGWMRIAKLAEQHALPASSHLWPEVSAHLLAATPTAQWLEYADWWNPIMAHPLELKDGMAVPSTRPGSGVEWNETAIAKLAG
jgi:mandelate racemase